MPFAEGPANGAAPALHAFIVANMKTVLICHAGDRLNETGLARWMASFSELTGIVVLHETNRRMWKRIRREVKRVGLARFADVLAFRLYYRAVHAAGDRRWADQRLRQIC